MASYPPDSECTSGGFFCALKLGGSVPPRFCRKERWTMMFPTEFCIPCQHDMFDRILAGDVLAWQETVPRSGLFRPRPPGIRTVVARAIGSARGRVVLKVLHSVGYGRLEPGELIWRSPRRLVRAGACRRAWGDEAARALSLRLSRVWGRRLAVV